MGLSDVASYIQSGNVVFSTRVAKAKLIPKIEKTLAKEFDYQATVVLRSDRQLQNVVTNAPKGFGTQPDKYRSDVVFLKAPLTAARAIKEIPTREGVDAVYGGKGVLYFTRLIAQASKSRLARLTSMPIYQQVTIRNWRTTTKLLAMM